MTDVKAYWEVIKLPKHEEINNFKLKDLNTDIYIHPQLKMKMKPLNDAHKSTNLHLVYRE